VVAVLEQYVGGVPEVDDAGLVVGERNAELLIGPTSISISASLACSTVSISGRFCMGGFSSSSEVISRALVLD
jgi:hypothetical protein